MFLYSKDGAKLLVSAATVIIDGTLSQARRVLTPGRGTATVTESTATLHTKSTTEFRIPRLKSYHCWTTTVSLRHVNVRSLRKCLHFPRDMAGEALEQYSILPAHPVEFKNIGVRL